MLLKFSFVRHDSEADGGKINCMFAECFPAITLSGLGMVFRYIWLLNFSNIFRLVKSIYKQR